MFFCAVISSEDSESNEEEDSTEISSSALRHGTWVGEDGEDCLPQTPEPQASELKSPLANIRPLEGAEQGPVNPGFLFSAHVSPDTVVTVERQGNIH